MQVAKTISQAATMDHSNKQIPTDLDDKVHEDHGEAELVGARILAWRTHHWMQDVVAIHAQHNNVQDYTKSQQYCTCDPRERHL